MLAGKGLYPTAFVDGAGRQTEPVRVVAMGFTGETDPALENSVDAMGWCRVGQMSKIVKFFKKEGGDRNCDGGSGDSEESF